MPETLIPVIAIVGPALTGSPPGHSAEVGVGAILGAPFMLATLAMFVTGTAILIFARRSGRDTALSVNVRVLGRDVIFFVIAYAIAIGSAFVPDELRPLRWGIAAVLVTIYAVYVRAHFGDPAEEGDAGELNQLHLTRLRPASGVDIDVLPGEDDGADDGTPRLRIIVTQVVVALALIIVGARVFVGAVEHLSTLVGLDPKILALIIAPIATELPEKFNSVIWVRSGKDTLAMGNITGAMVFQSCLPTVLGILFTEWTFGAESALSFASAGAAFAATFLIFGTMLTRGRLSAWSLLIGGPIYLAYIAAALLLPS
jgi:cation:H+ antiporter